MRCVRDEKNKIVTRGELIPCATERDIFERLGLQYKEPWDRPLFDLKSMILRPLSDNPAGNWYGNGLGNGKGYRFGLRPSGTKSDNGNGKNESAGGNALSATSSNGGDNGARLAPTEEAYHHHPVAPETSVDAPERGTDGSVLGKRLYG